MRRFGILFALAASAIMPGAVPAWGRGFGEAHPAAGGGGFYGGGGGGYSRVPTPSRPSSSFHGSSGFSTGHGAYNVAPSYHSQSGANFRTESRSLTRENVRPDFGERSFDSRNRAFTGPGSTGRNVAAANHPVNNHWQTWHEHTLHASWYHGNWHGHWDSFWQPGWQNWWAQPWYARPVFWGVTGWWLGASVYNWGYIPYYNPYYIDPVVLGSTAIDYGQPLQVVDYSPDPPDGSTTAPLSADGMREAEAARKAFYDQAYETALSEIDHALGKMPGDPALHEFRALVLFALGRYPSAAATIHSLLAVGPGWDWTTMIELYPSSDVYTRQLRALELYRRDHPKDAASRFLLAYHYLTCGHTQAALRELREVVHLIPQDRVASQLISMITAPPDAPGSVPAQSDAGKPLPEEPLPPSGQPSNPIDPAALLGTWTARRDDGSAIQLSLTPGNKFTWRYTHGDRSQVFSGSSTVTNNLLVLQQPNGESMIGRIVPVEGRGFRFLLMGGPPDDPGLTFTQ